MNILSTMYFLVSNTDSQKDKATKIKQSSKTQLKGIMDEMVKNRQEIARQTTEKTSQPSHSSASGNQPSTSTKQVQESYSIDQWKAKCKLQYKEIQLLKNKVKELEGLNSRLQHEILDNFGEDLLLLVDFLDYHK